MRLWSFAIFAVAAMTSCGGDDVSSEWENAATQYSPPVLANGDLCGLFDFRNSMAQDTPSYAFIKCTGGIYRPSIYREGRNADEKESCVWAAKPRALLLRRYVVLLGKPGEEHDVRNCGKHEDAKEAIRDRDMHRRREESEKPANKTEQAEHRVERVHYRASSLPLDYAALRVDGDVEDRPNAGKQRNRRAPARNGRAPEKTGRQAKRHKNIGRHRHDETAAAPKARHYRTRAQETDETPHRP